jgi:hypothetical protein
MIGWCLCVQAVSTTIASDGMEAARRACGGHGYSLLSGLPTTFTHYVQNVTWEGDNNVMLLQALPLRQSMHFGVTLSRLCRLQFSINRPQPPPPSACKLCVLVCLKRSYNIMEVHASHFGY